MMEKKAMELISKFGNVEVYLRPDGEKISKISGDHDRYSVVIGNMAGEIVTRSKNVNAAMRDVKRGEFVVDLNYGDTVAKEKERQFELALRIKKAELEAELKKTLGDRTIPKGRNLKTIAKNHASANGKGKVFDNPHYGVFPYHRLGWNNPVEDLWVKHCPGIEIQKAYGEHRGLFLSISRSIVLLSLSEYKILGDNGIGVVIFDKTGNIPLGRRFL